MSEKIFVQYLGYQAKLLEREYAFQVRDAGVDQHFTLDIANEAFLAHRVSYQDAPGICSQRLHSELAAHENHPSETHYVITHGELEAYRSSRVQKSTRFLSPSSKA